MTRRVWNHSTVTKGHELCQTSIHCSVEAEVTTTNMQIINTCIKVALQVVIKVMSLYEAVINESNC